MSETNEKIDMSLDDLIRTNGRYRAFGRKRGSALQQKSRPNFRRSFGGRFGGQQNNRQNNRFGRNRDQSNSQSSNWLRKSQSLNCRLMVSNLAYSVTDDDLYELFASFGPLKKSTVHYDQFGNSLGTAELVFEMRFDAIKAVKQYNGVPLDGRPMRIRVIGDKVGDESPATVTRGGFGGRGRGRGGQTNGRQRVNVTAEDLDKDLDSWRMETQ